MKKQLIMLWLCIVSTAVFAKDIILDDKAVQIDLPVGKEVSITFPKTVTTIDPLDAEKDEAFTRILRPDGVLLIKALEPVGESRLIAKMIDDNLVVLDVNAKVGALNYPSIKLIDPKTLKQNVAPAKQPQKVQAVQKTQEQPKENPHKPAFLKDGAAKTQNVAEHNQTASGGIGFNQMVQFGFRHFAGPSRLIGNLKAKEIKVGQKNVNNWVRVWGNRIAIKPLRQWKIQDQYLTVLLVNNTSPHPVDFDPRALRGRIMFAAALSPVIAPQGRLEDQTLWAVITEVPFNRAIR